MVIDFLVTNSSDARQGNTSGISKLDSEKSNQLLNSSKAKFTERWLHVLMKEFKLIVKSEIRFRHSEDGAHIILFHVIEDIDEQVESKIRENMQPLIDGYTGYLVAMTDFNFSKDLHPSLQNIEQQITLKPNILKFFKEQIENDIKAKGYCKLTGFTFGATDPTAALKITRKEAVDADEDTNMIHQESGWVKDFDYNKQKFTLVNELKEEIFFYFAEDEFESLTQEAYYHRYSQQPDRVITVNYQKLEMGNFVCVELTPDHL